MGTVLIYALLAAVLASALSVTIRRSRKGSACCGEHVKVKKVRARGSRKDYPHEASAGITGMMCENCAAKVQNALNALPGVSARVTIDGKKAEILSKEPLDEQTVRRTVHEGGYGISGFKIIS